VPADLLASLDGPADPDAEAAWEAPTSESGPMELLPQGLPGDDLTSVGLSHRLEKRTFVFGRHIERAPVAESGCSGAAAYPETLDGTFKPTGKSLDAQVCHVWDVKDGKVTRFQQYVDTAKLRHVMGAR
jgi:ketosteroid isomerase-like protein